MTPAETRSEDLTVTDIARKCNVHPSAVTRWMLKGTLLNDGRRLFLRFVRLPGKYHIKPEWLDEFLEALTADRLRESSDQAEAVKPASGSIKGHAELKRVDAALAEAGF
jgi:hypothetical protein